MEWNTTSKLWAVLKFQGLVVDIISGNITVFTDNSGDLTAYTVYQYQVTATNSAGQLTSNWTDVLTFESTPSAPSGSTTVILIGAYDVLISWSAPSSPNGLLLSYLVEYAPVSSTMISIVTVAGQQMSTSVSGLAPYTAYKVRVSAQNSAATGPATGWTQFTTGMASPTGLSAVVIVSASNGTSASVSWSAPTHPNGPITSYSIYLNDRLVLILNLI